VHIWPVLGSFHSLTNYLVTSDSLLVEGIFIYATLVIVSVGVFYLLKYLGMFKIKNVKVNEELAEADTDYYRKSSNFGGITPIIHKNES
jgi:hypothetical protein